MDLRKDLRGKARVVPFDALAPLLAAIPSLPRPMLARLTEVMIDQLDIMDGDPDLEDGDPPEGNGDELDGNPAEDEFCAHQGTGPGCLISDPDMAVDDRGCDDVNGDREPEEYADEFCDRAAYYHQLKRIRRDRCFRNFRYLRDWRTGKITGRELINHELLKDVRRPTRQQLFTRKRGMPRRPRA